MSIAQNVQGLGAAQVSWPQVQQAVVPADPALDGDWVIQARRMNPILNAKLILSDALMTELWRCLNQIPDISFLSIALGKLNQDQTDVVEIKIGSDKTALEIQCAAANAWSIHESPAFFFQVVSGTT